MNHVLDHLLALSGSSEFRKSGFPVLARSHIHPSGSRRRGWWWLVACGFNKVWDTWLSKERLYIDVPIPWPICIRLCSALSVYMLVCEGLESWIACRSAAKLKPQLKPCRYCRSAGWKPRRQVKCIALGSKLCNRVGMQVGGWMPRHG